MENSAADTGIPSDFGSGVDGGESNFDPQENYNFEEEENSNEYIPDETADYVFNSKPQQTKKQYKKKLKPIETKLENESSQRYYYKVCKKLESIVPQSYNDNVINNFSVLLDNQKVVQKEYGTQEDQPNGEWIIDIDSADEKTLEREINKLTVKLENVQKENKTLETKKQTIQKRLDKALDENNKLKAKLDQ